MRARMLKTLLLNANYEILSFVSERKAFRLLYKDKCEVISVWQDKLKWGQEIINHPSILKLKNYVKIKHLNCTFSRKLLIKRDQNSCQYCGKKLNSSQITIDHVIPKSLGGTTSFTNCVVSCFLCNNKKAGRTPEQAEMVLLKKPAHPSFSVKYNFCFEESNSNWHKDWNLFFNN